MRNRSSTDQDFNLWVLLNQVNDTIYKARQKELKPYSISSRKAAVLFIIQAIGNKATPAKIGRWLLRESQSISELLTRMENEGLVRRTNDLGRRNLVRITLTEKGRQVYYQSTERKSFHRILSSLSKEQHRQLRLCLKILREKALEELGIEYRALFP